MRRVTGSMLLALLVAALTGCTLSFSGGEEQALPEFSGPPAVRIVSPLPNTTYLSGVTVNVQVQVTNAGADIDRVEVSVGGQRIGTLPQPNPTSAAAFGVTQTFVADAAGSVLIEAMAYRSDGTASTPSAVTIHVVDELPSTSAPSVPSNTPQSQEPTATNTIAVILTEAVQAAQTSVVPTSPPIIIPTTDPAASQPTVQPTVALPATLPVAKFEGVVNVRSGPSQNFEPPLGTFQPGQQTNIVAVNTDATWLKVEFGTGTGWVFASIVKVEGDINTLPREAGPPIPTARPVTNTPVPAVQPTSDPGAAPTTPPTTADGPNLVVVNWEIRQFDGTRPVNDVQAGQQAVAFVRVRNAGNRSSGGFFTVLTIVNSADGGIKIVEATPTDNLDPGAETVVQIGYIETAPAGSVRAAVARIDENNQVAETNEGDNASPPITYTVAP